MILITLCQVENLRKIRSTRNKNQSIQYKKHVGTTALIQSKETNTLRQQLVVEAKTQTKKLHR